MKFHFLKVLLVIPLMSGSSCRGPQETKPEVRIEAEFGSLEYFLDQSSVILEVAHYREGDFIKATLKEVIFREDGVELPYRIGDEIPFVNERTKDGVDYGDGSLVFLGGKNLDSLGLIVVEDGDVRLSLDEVGVMAKRIKENKP